jgi:integrase
MPFQKQEQVIESPAFAKFLDSLEGMDDDTTKDYRNKVRPFVDFCKAKYGLPVDEIIKQAKADKRDKFDVLSDYKAQLSREGKEANNLRALVKKARAFMEAQGIEYSDRQFKIRVKLPRTIKHKKTPLKKETIRELIRVAPNIYLKSLLLFVAATGMRPIEALSIRHKDLDLDSNPGCVTIQARYTKMKQERFTFLTAELVRQVKDLIAYKHRERDLACKRKDGKFYNVELKPVARPNDLLFSIYRRDETAKVPKVQSLYNTYNMKLNSMLDTMGLDAKEDDGRRRKITEYSLRRYVKSTISNAGFADFSEWYVGHRHSEYWNVDDEEKIAVFNKIEDRLTFMDITRIEARGATVESKLEASEARYLMLQEQTSLMMQITLEPDETKKKELTKLLIEKFGYRPSA